MNLFHFLDDISLPSHWRLGAPRVNFPLDFSKKFTGIYIRLRHLAGVGISVSQLLIRPEHDASCRNIEEEEEEEEEEEGEEEEEEEEGGEKEEEEWEGGRGGGDDDDDDDMMMIMIMTTTTTMLLLIVMMMMMICLTHVFTFLSWLVLSSDIPNMANMFSSLNNEASFLLWQNKWKIMESKLRPIFVLYFYVG